MKATFTNKAKGMIQETREISSYTKGRTHICLKFPDGGMLAIPYSTKCCVNLGECVDKVHSIFYGYTTIHR